MSNIETNKKIDKATIYLLNITGIIPLIGLFICFILLFLIEPTTMAVTYITINIIILLATAFVVFYTKKSIINFFNKRKNN